MPASYALTWDAVGERIYETGTKMGVIYPEASDGTYPKGYAWNGLTAVTESPSGADATALYADDIKYLNLRAAEEFGATIEAYSYPDEFAECDGTAIVTDGVYLGQQVRKPFGFTFRSTVGNDTSMTDYGYKLHLIYNATASPSERSYSTINDSPDAISFSWELTTTPISVTGYKPISNIVIDSTKVNSAKLADLEQILYGTPASNGTAAVDARLPLPDEVISTLGGPSGATGATGATGTTN